MSRPPTPTDPTTEPVILYDGVCIFCSHWIRLVASRDDGRYRFTQIQSPYGRALAGRLGIDPDNPDTNALVEGGVARFKSDGALAILATLPGWSWTAHLGAIPRPLRDWIYDRVARNRYRLFGRTDTCMRPPPGLAGRVITD